MTWGQNFIDNEDKKNGWRLNWSQRLQNIYKPIAIPDCKCGTFILQSVVNQARTDCSYDFLVQ